MRFKYISFGYRPRFSFTVVLVFTAVLVFSFSQSIAGPSLTIDSDKQFAFAEYYFNKGDFRKSIDEYQRFIYFFPVDKRVEAAMFKSGMAHFYSRQYKEAISAFSAVINKYQDSELSFKSYLMISDSYLKRDVFDSAVITLHNLINAAKDVEVKDEAYYRLGWINVETASWEKARSYFAKISARNKEKYSLKRLSSELDKEKLIPRKNPELAGALSIIPGAGQLYVGRRQDALIAFLLNAGLIWAAYESFDNELYALGGLISLVEIGFYGGNIYGAVSGAHKYNRNQTHRFIEKLKQNTKIKLSGDHKKRKILFSLRVDF